MCYRRLIMGKIIKLGVFVVLVYVAIQKVPPWIDKVTDMGSGLGRRASSVSQSQCVATAEEASETFNHEMRGYQKPPFDLDAWGLSMERVRGAVYDAESRCDCGRDSCQRALEAISELNGLIASFDNSLRGDGTPVNAARRQETIDRLLKRARELDRQGS